MGRKKNNLTDLTGFVSDPSEYSSGLLEDLFAYMESMNIDFPEGEREKILIKCEKGVGYVSMKIRALRRSVNRQLNSMDGSMDVCGKKYKGPVACAEVVFTDSGVPQIKLGPYNKSAQS